MTLGRDLMTFGRDVTLGSDVALREVSDLWGRRGLGERYDLVTFGRDVALAEGSDL